MNETLKPEPVPLALAGWANCQRCGLSRVRRRVVFGRGSLPCDVLFLGIAPGNGEDLIGSPFIGRAGRCLDRAIKMADATGLRLFFDNMVACLPANEPRGHFRDPWEDEIVACRPRLATVVSLARPRRIVALGDLVRAEVLWKDAVKLRHPSYLLQVGGLDTAEGRRFVRELEDVFDGLREEA